MLNERNILIVDDDSITRLIHKNIINSLTEFRITSSEASNGLEALDLIVTQYTKDKTLPDFILLDTSMPIMDGFAFLEELQRLDFLKHLSIIIVTVSSDHCDKVRSKALNVKYFFTKPLKIALLRDAILEIILANPVR